MAATLDVNATAAALLTATACSSKSRCQTFCRASGARLSPSLAGTHEVSSYNAQRLGLSPHVVTLTLWAPPPVRIRSSMPAAWLPLPLRSPAHAGLRSREVGKQAAQGKVRTAPWVRMQMGEPMHGCWLLSAAAQNAALRPCGSSPHQAAAAAVTGGACYSPPTVASGATSAALPAAPCRALRGHRPPAAGLPLTLLDCKAARPVPGCPLLPQLRQLPTPQRAAGFGWLQARGAPAAAATPPPRDTLAALSSRVLPGSGHYKLTVRVLTRAGNQLLVVHAHWLVAGAS